MENWSLYISCAGLTLSIIGFVFTIIIWKSTDKAYRNIKKIIKRELIKDSKFFVYYQGNEKDPRSCLLLEPFMSETTKKLYKGLPPSSWNSMTIKSKWIFAGNLSKSITKQNKLLSYSTTGIYVNSFLSKTTLKRFKKQVLSDEDIKQIDEKLEKIKIELSKSVANKN